MSAVPVMGDLVSSDFESGCNAKLEGFISIRSVGKSRGREVVLLGQLNPASARQMGEQLLEVAEAAEHDAMVAAQLVEDGVSFDTALHFVGMLRARRRP